MPELPEVETIRSGLSLSLPGRTIAHVDIRVAKLISRPSPEDFAASLTGQTYTSLRRKGKILIIDLTDFSLLVRLGMTGQLTFRTPERPDQDEFTIHPITGLQRAVQHVPDKHTHIIIEHSDGTQLNYRDIRKFGHWFLYPRHLVDDSRELKALGPDPLSPEFTQPALQEALSHTHRCIKAALLDQALICGLGNIYVDEVLFQSHVRPDRPACEINAEECSRMYTCIPQILLSSIANRGTTFSDYRDSHGNPGDNAESLKAYGRYGQPCLVCGSEMQRSTLGGRTSSWCPNCQH